MSRPFFVTGEPKTLRSTSDVASEKEGKNLLPRPAGCALADAAQDAVALLCCRGSLLTPVPSVVRQVLFFKAASQSVGPQPALLHGLILAQVQDFVFAFSELEKVSVSPFFQPVQVLLNRIPCSSAYGLYPAWILSLGYEKGG